MAEAPWWGGIAVLATARWIHVVHLESGMRTRPDAVPGTGLGLGGHAVFVVDPEVWWWGSLLLGVAMGQALRLRMVRISPAYAVRHGHGGDPPGQSRHVGLERDSSLVLCAWRTPEPGEAALVQGA